jgi:hypothetical protein
MSLNMVAVTEAESHRKPASIRNFKSVFPMQLKLSYDIKASESAPNSWKMLPSYAINLPRQLLYSGT